MNYCSANSEGVCPECGIPFPNSAYERECMPRAHWIQRHEAAMARHEPQSLAHAHAHAPDLARTDAPSFLTKVKNFASATVHHVAAGMPLCDDAEIIRRHDICLTCEHLQNDVCNLCGCPVSRVAGYASKLAWADQSCPAGKWGAAVSKQ